MTEAQIVRAANERWPHQFPDAVEPEIVEELNPYDLLLVEQSNITGDYHLSLHATRDAAFTYQVEQECAEDWDPVALVTLCSGRYVELERTYGVRTTAEGRLAPRKATA